MPEESQGVFASTWRASEQLVAFVLDLKRIYKIWSCKLSKVFKAEKRSTSQTDDLRWKQFTVVWVCDEPNQWENSIWKGWFHLWKTIKILKHRILLRRGAVVWSRYVGPMLLLICGKRPGLTNFPIHYMMILWKTINKLLEKWNIDSSQYFIILDSSDKMTVILLSEFLNACSDWRSWTDKFDTLAAVNGPHFSTALGRVENDTRLQPPHKDKDFYFY